MSQEDIPFYPKVNNTKIKKGPLLRVQQKKAKKMKNSNSTLDLNINDFNFIKSKNSLKTETNPMKEYFCQKPIQKYNSSTYFPKYELDKKDLTITPGRIITNRNNGNKKTNFEKGKKFINKKKNNYNLQNKIRNDNNNDNKEQELYCVNCINKKMNINKNLPKYIRRNNSYDFTFQENFFLKNLDEEYINNKIIRNERKQLAAFNQLKKYKEKNPKSKKDKLQELYENSEYPFHGLNLQDYLYYNNKKRNERINNLVLKNINSYLFTQPRKEINDYYNKVMFQTPILERDVRPSNKYKIQYMETLQKQIDENKKFKNNQKKIEQNKEKEELNKYNELILKIDADKKHQNLIKQNIINENNINMSNIKKEQDELNKSDVIKGYKDRQKIFTERQNEYKSFINQQRLNEMKNLQNWINENKKKKMEQTINKDKENSRWKKYHKQYNDSFDDNIYVDKCAECNLPYTNRLYPLQTS